MGFLAMKTNEVVFCFILRTFSIPWSFFEGCIYPDRKEVMNCEMPLGGSLPSVWQPPFICDVLMRVFVLMSFFLLPLLCSSSPTRWDMTLVDQIVYWTNVKKSEHHRSSSVWEEYAACTSLTQYTPPRHKPNTVRICGTRVWLSLCISWWKTSDKGKTEQEVLGHTSLKWTALPEFVITPGKSVSEYWHRKLEKQ